MIRLLPFILIPVLLVAGLWYWRSSTIKQNLATPQTAENTAPVEVPKTLPGATLEDRVKSLEGVVTKLAAQVNVAKTSPAPTNLDARLNNAESAITELKARVSALEQASPAPAAAVSGSKYPLYIPMSAGGGPWTDQDWHTLTEYQTSVNSDNYSGYSSVQLEANFRLVEAAGTGSVRLYNVTDGTAVSNSQLDTTGTSFSLQASGTFKLPSGQKTYTIQVKSTLGTSLFVQTARIKVNF